MLFFFKCLIFNSSTLFLIHLFISISEKYWSFNFDEVLTQMWISGLPLFPLTSIWPWALINHPLSPQKLWSEHDFVYWKNYSECILWNLYYVALLLFSVSLWWFRIYVQWQAHLDKNCCWWHCHRSVIIIISAVMFFITQTAT